VPKVSKHVNAALLYFSGLRILVLIDHVLVDRKIHQATYLVVGIGGTERCHVLARVAVHEQFVTHKIEHCPRL